MNCNVASGRSISLCEQHEYERMFKTVLDCKGSDAEGGSWGRMLASLLHQIWATNI